MRTLGAVEILNNSCKIKYQYAKPQNTPMLEIHYVHCGNNMLPLLHPLSAAEFGPGFHKQ